MTNPVGIEEKYKEMAEDVDEVKRAFASMPSDIPLAKKRKGLDFLVGRLKEPSTWRGLAAIATACGAYMSPEMVGEIVTCGFTIIGLLGVATRDKKE